MIDQARTRLGANRWRFALGVAALLGVATLLVLNSTSTRAQQSGPQAVGDTIRIVPNPASVTQGGTTTVTIEFVRATGDINAGQATIAYNQALVNATACTPSPNGCNITVPGQVTLTYGPATATGTVVFGTITFTGLAAGTSQLDLELVEAFDGEGNDITLGTTVEDGSITVTVEGPDLAVTKAANPTTVTSGDTVTYTVTVSNIGTQPAANVTLTDILPAGVTFVSATASQGTCSGTTTVTCNLNTINNGANATATITVTANNVAAQAMVMNTATATTTTTEPNSANNAGSVTITVNPPSANLGITKADNPDPVRVGSTLTYTITVTNAGPNAATNVVIDDDLPANVTLVSATGSAGVNCNNVDPVQCTILSLANGASATVTITVTPQAAAVGTLSNTATVDSDTDDPTPGNNTATVMTTVQPAEADLSITKADAPDPVLVGSNITYTLTVNNAGPSTATNVTITDDLPANVTFVSANGSGGVNCTGTDPVVCTIASLASGASASATIVVTAPTLGTVTNTATVANDVTDPNPANNSSTATTQVVAASADLSITKTDNPDPVLVGSNLTFTITVNNAGPNNAPNTTVTDTLPGNVTFVSATASQGTCTGNPAISCNLGTLNSGATATVTIVIQPQAAAVGTLTNTANVASDIGDPAQGNNSATATTTVNAAQADLSITKTDSPDPVSVGQNLTYTITVNNAGPQPAANVVVTDTLPGNFTFVSATASQGTCTGTTTVTCNLGTVNNGAGATVTIVVTPQMAAIGTATNTATVASTTADPAMANNTATAETTVIEFCPARGGCGGTTTPPATGANLAITKTDTPDPVVAGQNLTYTITVQNLGPSAATNTTLVDQIPFGLTFVSATPSQGTCIGTTTVQCNLGTLNNGATATVTIVVQTAASMVTTQVSNTTCVGSAVTDPVNSNNCATVTTTVTGTAGGPCLGRGCPVVTETAPAFSEFAADVTTLVSRGLNTALLATARQAGGTLNA